MPKVAVVTDSAAGIPHALQARYGVTVVPLHLAIGDEIFSEGVNISPPRVVAALMSGERVRPFEPPVAEFSAAYQACADAGSDYVVSVHLSHKLPHLYDHAVEAATHAPLPVHVVDSGTTSLAEGFAALGAAAVAGTGAGPDACAQAAHDVVDSSRLMMTVETLDYVHRDGRVPTVLKHVANATKMRALLEVKDGDIAMVDRVRHTEPARAALRDRMTEFAATLERPFVAVSLVGASAAEAGLMVDVPNCIEVSPGASLAAHTGPGTYSVAAASMPPEFTL